MNKFFTDSVSSNLWTKSNGNSIYLVLLLAVVLISTLLIYSMTHDVQYFSCNAQDIAAGMSGSVSPQETRSTIHLVSACRLCVLLQLL